MKNQRAASKIMPDFICVLGILMIGGLLVTPSVGWAQEDT